MMAQDQIILVITLEKDLQQGSLMEFKPTLELVGSMAEGTRIGLANELDLSIKFLLWRNQVPFKIESDPFSLKKAQSSPPIMDEFFHEDRFQFHKFMHFLLDAVHESVDRIFEQNRNPPNLRRVTTNREWSEGRSPCTNFQSCKASLPKTDFVQCPMCSVTVSQTKKGVALQLEWVSDNGTRVYCSIDLIPMFQIEPIPPLRLTRLIVENMIGDDPPQGWLSFLFKYAEDYKIIQELTRLGSGDVTSVGLKTMSFFEGKNHHVTPVQEFTRSKFSSERMRDIYSYIKFLKKALDLKLSSYWVKKELLKADYQSILESCETDDVALVQILSQPELSTKVNDKINMEDSLRSGYVNLRRSRHQLQMPEFYKGLTKNTL